MAIEEKIKKLTPESQKEVMDFVDFLRDKRKPKATRTKKPNLNWF